MNTHTLFAVVVAGLAGVSIATRADAQGFTPMPTPGIDDRSGDGFDTRSGVVRFDRLPLYGRPDPAESLFEDDPEPVPTPAGEEASQDFEPLAVQADRSRPVASRHDWTQDESLRRRQALPSTSAAGATIAESAARIRQTRAIYQMQQRLARIERDAWAGHQPLRPAMAANPMAGSYYPVRPTVVVPVYLWNR